MKKEVEKRLGKGEAQRVFVRGFNPCWTKNAFGQR
jgi:hypothetical protein